MVDGDVKVSINTSVAAEAPTAAVAEDVAESEAAVAEPNRATAVRASLLAEPLPPNPYAE